MSDHLVKDFLFENPLRSCAKSLRSFPKVRPVLKRASSVKQIGSAVLESPLSAYAAVRIDGAINVADKYVEKYLPSEDQIDCKPELYLIIVFRLRHKKKHAMTKINGKIGQCPAPQRD